MSKSRKKKGTTAEKRRQDEIQKRMDRAAANAEKKKKDERAAAGPAPVIESKEPAAADAGTRPAAQEPKREPVSRPRPRRERRRVPRPEPGPMPSRRLLSIDGDGNVPLPVRMGLADLFKAIRNDFPSGCGSLYISLGSIAAGGGKYDMSYSYNRGLFNRLEPLSGKGSEKNPPVLADVLDARVTSLRADVSDNSVDWYAGVAAQMPDAET